MHSSIAHTSLSQPWKAYVPPLDIARDLARQTLAEADAVDVASAPGIDVYGAFGALQQTLRQVLAALDAEDGRHA